MVTAHTQKTERTPEAKRRPGRVHAFLLSLPDAVNPGTNQACHAGDRQ